MMCEKITDFKESITGSIPIIEDVEVKQSKDITNLAKVPCLCGQTKNVKHILTNGKLISMCRECRKPTIIDVTARSLITQIDDNLQVSNLKVLSVLDLIGEITAEHKIVRVSQQSTGLQHKTTRSKTVDIIQKYGLKISRGQPTVTLI